ncbi:hypothetical protein STRCR_0266 [Streptococcus criceti HS-6]|uniref:Uncharacterized protein n=1 Tax=Streptococcus criceti HS-6 TaxID=873449 RepID=G5JP34_STRCG|nr:hypothetical protein STRCR_0266 [Streptococcus criceti HS-6]
MLRASGGFDLVHLEAPNAFVAIDMTESPIQHLSKNQSRNHFGTKKRPTLKHKCSLI